MKIQKFEITIAVPEDCGSYTSDTVWATLNSADGDCAYEVKEITEE